MQIYLVFMPEGQADVETQFPQNHRISENLWAVGSPLSTSAEVCFALGIDEPRTMVVTPMEGYYGHYDRALWQKLGAWSNA